MEPISSEIVERTWKKIGKMSPLEIPKMAYRMREKQPIILAYLLVAGHDILNVLNEVVRTNLEMIESLGSKSEAGFTDAMKEMLGSYPQPEVLKYVVEALVEEHEEGCLIRDENKGMMMLYLKTVIDCFNRQ